MMNKFQNLINFISKNDKFLLTSHVNPDGDSIGSLLGLKHILEPYAQRIDVVLSDQTPEYLDFLEGTDEIYSGDELSSEIKDRKYDSCFILDCGALDRIGAVQEFLSGAEKIINIDHHDDNDGYGDCNYVDSTVSSTGELIYNLAVELGVNFQIDFGMAISTAIITDTGNFKYPNTSPETHRIIADMLELGVDTRRIVEYVYETESYNSMKLKGEVLAKIKLTAQQKVAWTKVKQSTLKRLGADWEDTEGLVNYPRNLKGVEVGVLLKEVAADRTRVSLRSRKYFPVNEFAHQFGGGGHPRAAGCTIEKSLVEAEELLIDKLKTAIVTKDDVTD